VEQEKKYACTLATEQCLRPIPGLCCVVQGIAGSGIVYFGMLSSTRVLTEASDAELIPPRRLENVMVGDLNWLTIRSRRQVNLQFEDRNSVSNAISQWFPQWQVVPGNR
jgi:hypothetical protein